MQGPASGQAVRPAAIADRERSKRLQDNLAEMRARFHHRMSFCNSTQWHDFVNERFDFARGEQRHDVFDETSGNAGV